MTGAATWEQLAWFVAAVGAILSFVGGVWWRLDGQFKDVRARVEKLRDEHRADVAKVREELIQYKMQVPREFVRLGHLREVETRILTALNEFKDEFRDLRKDILGQLRSNGGGQ